MNKFKAAIFDMDGLLIDSEKLCLQAYTETCDKFELGDLTEFFMRCVGCNAELCEIIVKEGLADKIDYDEFRTAWSKAYDSLTEKPVPLMTGVTKVLDQLKSLGIPMVVATSTKTDKAHEKLKRSNIHQYFEHIIGGDQVSNSKPDPEIYLKAAAYLSIDPSDCIAFEDSSNGVRSAVAAGMTVVQVPDLIKPDQELLSLGHIVLDHIDDVIAQGIL